jgi:hypothetical protein
VNYTASALLASIRRRGALPTATAVGCADADLLSVANEELQSYLAPLILDLREEYFAFRSTLTTAAGTAEYRIPSRAIGAKLREVEILATGGEVRNLELISLDELEEWPQSGQGTPGAFYLRGNSVALVPTPSAAETLRLTYFLRPSEVTATAGNYATIATLSGSTITTSGAHGFTTATVCDFVKAQSPFEILSIDATPAVASGSDLEFASVPSDLAVGDYVCKAELSPVPQLPADFQPLLAQRVAMKVLESLGLSGKHELAARRLVEMEEQLRRTFAPRVDGEPKICAPNSFGLMGGWYG